jgi:pimeloyl-ACP methyl ester carboxylesterase
MKNPLLFLHGAIGASDQLLPLQSKFPGAFVFDFPGHGGKPFPAGPFSIRIFAESVLHFMEEKRIATADIFGYSMGGYVGLYLARHYPDRVGKIFTLATKFAWDEATAAKEVKMLDPKKIEEKVPKFAEALRKRHAPNAWQSVLHHTAEMMLSLGKDPELKPEDFTAISHPVLISIGDRDTMVSLEETIAVYRSLPNALFCVFPETPHPVEQLDLQRVLPVTERFFG